MRVIFLGLVIVSASLCISGQVHAQEDSEKISDAAGARFQKECEEDDVESCKAFVVYALQVKDFAGARDGMKRACKFGYSEGCDSVKRDDREGEEIRKRCESGIAADCAFYSRGRAHIYRDYLGSLQYAKKACKLGHEVSCKLVKEEAKKMKEGLGSAE